jgi:cytochrome c oxidase subunit 2
VIAALSTGHKTGLIAVAAVFIVFALVSSFVLPRRDPDFPGNRMGMFIGATVLLFAAMLAAVLIFGVEPKETRAGEVVTQAAPSSGDAAKGKTLFTSKNCAGCHSLDGSFITGPSLKGVAGTEVTLADGSKVTADDAYLLESIEDPGKQVVKCPNCGPPSPMATVIPKGSITPAQAADLVAYIKTQK